MIDFNTLKEKLALNGWIEYNVSMIENNKINENAKAFFKYGNRLSIIYYPNNNFLRLAISRGDEKKYFQIEYKNKLIEVVEKIISMQDKLSIETYLFDYQELNQICEVSILAYEQYL